MRQAVLAACLVAILVGLAGCASGGSTPTETEPTPQTTPTATPTPTPTPEPPGEFTTSVTWPAGGVVGEPMTVQVTVENTGEDTGTYEASLSADGEALTSKSVSVDPGETVTMTFEREPGSAGTFDVTVAGETRTLTVYGHELEFVDAAMHAVDTERTQKVVNETGEVVVNGQTYSYERDSSVIIERNFTAGTYYERDDVSMTIGGEPKSQTHERWGVDGRMYERQAKHTEGTTTYNSWETAEPLVSSALDIHGTDTEVFLSTAHTDEEFVFVFDPETSEGAQALMTRVIGPGEPYPAEHATDARLELHYDRETGRQTLVRTHVTIDGGDIHPTLDRTVEWTTIAYGEPVSVSVPQAVRENVTDS